MIDLALLRAEPQRFKDACQQKNVSVDIDVVLTLEGERRGLQSKIDEVNRERKEAAAGKDIERGKVLKQTLSELEAEYARIDAELSAMLFRLPNLPSSDTPVGPDESGNVILRKVGEPRVFGFEPKDHATLGEALGLIDTEKATEVSGTRFAYMKGGLVFLQNAVHQFVLSILTNEEALKGIIAKAGLTVSSKPFVPVIPPLFIRPDVFQKMARLEPREERYHLVSDDLYLIGSAEHTLGPLHMGETLKAEELPLRYTAMTSAFRREAGSYGKDMRGIIRLHQFEKMEMESFSCPSEGVAEQEFLVAIQEHVTSALGLPYQVVMTCTGDQGDPDARHVDIETWMPGQGEYRETHSADYMTDYQARRLGTKVSGLGEKSVFVHTNDATAFAGRTLVAILENYQEADGTIMVPEVLRPYMGGKKTISG